MAFEWISVGHVENKWGGGEMRTPRCSPPAAPLPPPHFSEQVLENDCFNSCDVAVACSFSSHISFNTCRRVINVVNLKSYVMLKATA